MTSLITILFALPSINSIVIEKVFNKLEKQNYNEFKKKYSIKNRITIFESYDKIKKLSRKENNIFKTVLEPYIHPKKFISKILNPAKEKRNRLNNLLVNFEKYIKDESNRIYNILLNTKDIDDNNIDEIIKNLLDKSLNEQSNLEIINAVKLKYYLYKNIYIERLFDIFPYRTNEIDNYFKEGRRLYNHIESKVVKEDENRFIKNEEIYNKNLQSNSPIITKNNINLDIIRLIAKTLLDIRNNLKNNKTLAIPFNNNQKRIIQKLKNNDYLQELVIPYYDVLVYINDNKHILNQNKQAELNLIKLIEKIKIPTLKFDFSKTIDAPSNIDFNSKDYNNNSKDDIIIKAANFRYYYEYLLYRNINYINKEEFIKLYNKYLNYINSNQDIKDIFNKYYSVLLCLDKLNDDNLNIQDCIRIYDEIIEKLKLINNYKLVESIMNDERIKNFEETFKIRRNEGYGRI